MRSLDRIDRIFRSMPPLFAALAPSRPTGDGDFHAATERRYSFHRSDSAYEMEMRLKVWAINRRYRKLQTGVTKKLWHHYQIRCPEKLLGADLV